MPPSNWDHRPKERVRHVTQPPRRRPILRVLLLIGLGGGLYFGFEPLASYWFKRNPTRKLTSSQIQKELPSVSSNKKDGSLSAPVSSKSEKLSNSMAIRQPDSIFSFTPNSDSSQWSFDCKSHGEGCTQALKQKREGLALWIGKSVGHAADQWGLEPFQNDLAGIQWSAIWKRELDLGLPEPGLRSLVKLSVRWKQNTQNFYPVHRETGWDLCPKSGCLTKTPWNQPTSSDANVTLDLEAQNLKVLGKAKFLSTQDGWVIEKSGEGEKTRVSIDHLGMDRTVYFGSLKPLGDLNAGQFIRGGKVLAASTGDSALVEITYYQGGSPELPWSWKEIHGP